MMHLAPNVTVLPVVTTLDLAAERVLQHALQSDLQCCVVVGNNADGSLYFSSTSADGGDVLWLFEKAKHALMEVRA